MLICTSRIGDLKGSFWTNKKIVSIPNPLFLWGLSQGVLWLITDFVLWQMKGHHFVSTQYTTPTYCNHCGYLLWGAGDQGYQCSSMFNDWNWCNKGACVVMWSSTEEDEENNNDSPVHYMLCDSKCKFRKVYTALL